MNSPVSSWRLFSRRLSRNLLGKDAINYKLSFSSGLALRTQHARDAPEASFPRHIPVCTRERNFP
uniref:Uncharacterized protein n=1 Tax=Anguilla anguilla TaxID=7936 RepID=A0A0E9RHR6_ANGAN